MSLSSSKRGFTLLELLISLALLAIIFAFITGALSFTHKAWVISNDVSNKAPESVVQDFLRKHISAAIPMRRRGTGHNVELVFRGEEKRLEFITEMQERGVKAGLYRLVLFQEEDKLKLSIYPYHPVTGNGEGVETRVLMGGVRSLKIAYIGENRKSKWGKSDRLPSLVNMEIQKLLDPNPIHLRIDMKLQ